MVRSTAETPAQYLAELSDAVRAQIQPVLAVMRANIPDGFEESMDFGMITWSVPLSMYPDTYNKRPLMYAALAAQKRHIALYLMGTYATADGSRIDEAAIRERWSGGRALDMGKSCVRFRAAADLDLELVAEVLRQWTAADYVANAKQARPKKGD